MGYLLLVIGVVALIAFRGNRKEKPVAAGPSPQFVAGVARVRMRPKLQTVDHSAMNGRYWTYAVLFNGAVIALLAAGSGLAWQFGCFFVMMALFGWLPKLIFPTGWADREKQDHPGDRWMAFNFMTWLAVFLYLMLVA